MKNGVKLFDKNLRKLYYTWLSLIGIIGTLASIFITIPSLPSRLKASIGVVFALLLIAVYLIIWIWANRQKRIILTINNSKVEVKYGNIWDENSLKVIAFNEYFDTLVNDVVIASSSLNGQFIRNNIQDIEEFDKEIKENKHLLNRMDGINNNKKEGKTQKYTLGSIHVHNDFLLTAFTKFDEGNRAFLTVSDYLMCLLNFWNEVDIVYANRSVATPLLGGSSLTRPMGHIALTAQEKLDFLLWSFKVSQVRFSPPAMLTIVIDEMNKNKINLYQLKKYCD